QRGRRTIYTTDFTGNPANKWNATTRAHPFKHSQFQRAEGTRGRMPTGKWDIIGFLPEEFKSLQRIEKLVFKNENMETQCEQLGKMIEHFPNLNSFTIQCNHCSEFEKVITSLCQNTKMETLCIKKPMLNSELI
ncbi:unnamed protein product, partial [Staurois parvus]